MKRILLIMSIFMFMNTYAFGQDKLKTKTGTITFEASVPSFEEVKATNENVSALLNTETGDFAALALMKGFRFKVALMEEHFNENYVESSTYPKAVFKGSIYDFDMANVSETRSSYQLNGSITMHGETKEIATTVYIWMENSVLKLSTSFTLRPSDFNIKIPAVVSKKIAEEVEVDALFSLSN